MSASSHWCQYNVIRFVCKTVHWTVVNLSLGVIVDVAVLLVVGFDTVGVSACVCM